MVRGAARLLQGTAVYRRAVHSSALRSASSQSPSSSSATGSSSSTTSTGTSSAPEPPPPTSSSSTRARQSYWDVGLLAAAGAAISGLLLWRSSSANDKQREAEEMKRANASDKTFTVPVLSQTGGQGTKTLTLLSQHETDARLKENEVSYTVSRRANPVWRYDTNAVASNAPIEDDNCCVILERDPHSPTRGDLMFFGIFDGHAGWQTSRLLSSSLVAYVARELDLVYRGDPAYAQLLPNRQGNDPASKKPSFWSLFSAQSGPADANQPPQLDLQEPIVQAAIRNAFEKMDNEIVEAPVRRLNEYLQKGLAEPKKPDYKTERVMTPEQTEALQSLLPAMSGSCALLAFLDTARNKLHVANTGDARAVTGTWEPDPSGKGGKWRADVLTEDQTGRNEKEVARMRKEHPPDEAETVITRGRVLGSLEPTRAFGDARYKWPVGMQKRLEDAFSPMSGRHAPRNYRTPPYVTASPEITTVELAAAADVPSRKSTLAQSSKSTLASFLPVSPSSDDDAVPRTTRFIVMATDGLYDRLGNDEIVSLVGAHLSGVRGPQTRRAVLAHLAPSSFARERSQSHIPHQAPTRGEGDVYTFEDGNLSTHLVRNALGGAKKEQVSVLLSIPAPFSRRYRDDITVHVVLLRDGAAADATAGGDHHHQQQQGGVVKKVEPELLPSSSPVKAKL